MIRFLKKITTRFCSESISFEAPEFPSKMKFVKSEKLINAIEAARLAGLLISESVHERFVSKTKLDTHTEKSSAVDLQTETDIACEKVIKKHLEEKYPNYHFIGEESTEDMDGIPFTKAPTWIIDPIDGTTNFVSGMRCSCVLISHTVDKLIQLGVIFDPLNLEVFFAEAGKGAYWQKLDPKDLHPIDDPVHIAANKKTKLSEALLINDVGYKRNPEQVDHCFQIQKDLLTKGKIRGLRTLGMWDF